MNLVAGRGWGMSCGKKMEREPGKGRESHQTMMEVWWQMKKKGRGDVRGWGAVWRRLGTALSEVLSHSQLIEGSCASQGWVCFSTHGTCSHWLRATHGRCGLGAKAVPDFSAQQLCIPVICASRWLEVCEAHTPAHCHLPGSSRELQRRWELEGLASRKGKISERKAGCPGMLLFWGCLPVLSMGWIYRKAQGKKWIKPLQGGKRKPAECWWMLGILKNMDQFPLNMKLRSEALQNVS